MNLPAAIEALEQPIGIPKSVLERVAEVRSEGGMRSLSETVETLSVMASDAKERLKQCTAMLDEERASDDSNRRQYGGKWSVTPSSTLTNDMRQEISKRRYAQ